jgi:hypothetical protein
MLEKNMIFSIDTPLYANNILNKAGAWGKGTNRDLKNEATSIVVGVSYHTCMNDTMKVLRKDRKIGAAGEKKARILP